MELFSKILRFIRWHRGFFAGLMVALSAFLLLQQFVPKVGPGTAVVVAARSISAGAVVSAGDVEVAQVPPGVVPATAISAVDSVVGRTTTVGVGERQIVTETLLVSGRTAVTPGSAVIPVLVGDQLRPLLVVGGRVDLFGPPEANGTAPPALAQNALIVGLPQAQSGQFGPTTQTTVLVEVPAEKAALIAHLGISGRIGVAIR